MSKDNSSKGTHKKGDVFIFAPPEDDTNVHDDNLLNIAEGGNVVEEWYPGLPYSDFDAHDGKFDCIQNTDEPSLIILQRREDPFDFLQIQNAPGFSDQTDHATGTRIVLTSMKKTERYTANDDLPLKTKTSLLKRTISISDDKAINDHIQVAEVKYLMSCTSGHKLDENTKVRCCKIASAIFFDDGDNLKTLLVNDVTDSTEHISEERIPLLKKRNIREYFHDPLCSAEIQRRILEAVELDSLNCLNVLCDTYEKHPFSKKEDIHLFHRRFGLSFWPLSERPKETALHLIANKHTSVEAMEVLQKRPKFLDDFSDIPDSHDSSPLLLAIKCNNMEVVKRLLARKPDLNKRNKHDETPILVAALHDAEDVINEMLKTYPETELFEVMKKIDGKGHSILYPASQSGKAKVLNLIMEKGWWPDFLEQEKKITEEWESFVCNVCATGCIELAREILIQNNELLDAKCDKRAITPLMRAAEANQKEIVQLIFDINKSDSDLFMACDKNGRNVFHHAVGNPDILRYLLEKCTQSKSTKAINKMDKWEMTPIKLTAVMRLEESFKMLLNHTTNKEDLFAAHFIDSVHIEILKTGLLNWRRMDRKAVADLLDGKIKKNQPFLEAAKRGNVELMEFFLEQGANHLQKTPEDQTVLHYAVISGELAAMEFLLSRKEFREIIDFGDDKNMTAAGYATKLGKAAILRCLLENGAKMKRKTARHNILDCAYGHYETAQESLKEIIEFCTNEETKNDKTHLLQELFEDSRFGADRIMAQLIEKTPEVAMMIFDLCVNEHRHYAYTSYCKMEEERKVLYLFFPFKRHKTDGKLEAIESMVNNERDDCLGHPLVLRFLNYKMHSTGFKKWFYFNVFFYLTFLLTLTVYSTLQSQGLYNLKSPGMIALSLIILAFCALHFIKEILQLRLSTANYIKDSDNYIEWVIFICAVIYVVPGGSTKTKVQITAGVISVFLGWINFSFFLKRFSLFGIYIIMAKRVFRTVFKVLPFVLLFIVAFSLSFSLLLFLDKGFKNIPISILTTFVMMTGELDYRDIFLPSGPFNVLQKILLVLFILMISVTVMNLLTGLAVGDINDIMARSKEEKRISRAKLVITLERNFNRIPFLSPPEFKDFVEDPQEKECQSSWLLRQWKKVYDDDEVEEQLKVMAEKKKDDCAKQLNELKEEIKKTNEFVKEFEAKIENKLQNIEALLVNFQRRGSGPLSS
ncbi:transient receptor potential cation channel subfamily A member 1-like isoform X3 [Dendronephthya gigantea]|uniref:transient receptor potential cation channel subfamily A member 1-like isoform X3 n=1 Tax=Dendronephthya gigantea TaxID=151771 RepID=UPI00106ADB28|nr:transient receptor potential cation channel subfamily A member 1-like isoform X3 [Dendronephthya gigantea]